MSQIYNHEVGIFTSAGTDKTVTVGYSPKAVRAVNLDTLDIYYWTSALPSTQTVVTTSTGTSSINTSTLISAVASSGDTLDSVQFAAGIASATQKVIYEIFR